MILCGENGRLSSDCAKPSDAARRSRRVKRISLLSPALLPSPFMPNGQKSPAEMTVKAVALGLFLSLVFGSANAYLGMRAGQTVSATLPAAIIALALFRIPQF